MPKDERIVRCRFEDLPKGQTDWQRIDEQWFERAQLVIPAHLKHLFVQIDEDLMAWFRQ